MTLAARTMRLSDAPSLGDLVDALRGPFWSRGGDGFIAWGVACRIDPGVGEDRFERASAELRAVFESASIDDPLRRPGSGPVAFGSFTFDPSSPGSRVVVPAVLIARAGDEAWVTVCGDPDASVPSFAASESPSFSADAWHDVDERAWMHAVSRARAEIRAGWLAKVVLARTVTVAAPRAFDPRPVVRNLLKTFPDCYTFWFDGLLGASPELLVRRTGASIESLVLAGTARRGESSAEDDAIGAALLSSDKERSEHAFAADSARAVLELVCADLKADDEPSLLRLANVQHLATSVRGDLDRPLTALEIVARLHPTAAVCGVPTTDALAIIRASEGFDRGRYTGPIGWMDSRGDGEWAIALRCAELDGDRARLFAGNGIVADSDPEEELEETKIKLRAMQNAMG